MTFKRDNPGCQPGRGFVPDGRAVATTASSGMKAH